MKPQYEKYLFHSDSSETQLTKEILNSIKKGDLIKTEYDKKPQRVYGVSENYFVAATKAFGKFIYSIYDKNLCVHSGLLLNPNHFWRGTDNQPFGFYHLDCTGNLYNFESEIFITRYLEALENKDIGMSLRNSIFYMILYIKRSE